MLTAFALSAAEIAAAEAAAVIAAEAAAAAAAEAAAVEAAKIAAAEAAAATTAQTATQAGIMEVGGTTANAANAANAATTANAAAPLTTAEGVNAAAQGAGIQNVPQFSQAELEALTKGQELARVSSAAPPLEVTASTGQGSMLNAPLDTSNAAMRSGIVDPSIANMPAPSDAMMRAGVDPLIANGPAPTNAMMQGFTPNPNLPPATNLGPFNPPPPEPSALESGFTKAMDFADKNPFKTSVLAYTGAKMTGLLDPSGNGYVGQEYNGPLSKYRLSPDFKGTTANPANFQYTPRYAIGGGIMGPGEYDIPVGYDEGGDVPEYAKGGSLSDSIEQYQKMLDGKPREPLPMSRDVGIYYDQDPDTRYQDALTAAQIRQAKVNKRANVDLPGMKRPTPMGQLNLRPLGAKTEAGASSLDPENAASGGIMHSSLGGYAAGGNPRLLKGPGDGMSDNIPATISGRQPARLADGEFVIPADVVSHLGNGSTEAGAKQLHAMMDKIRKARTGNPKQGKQINPKKYMPK
jgi:hypothetical protein